MKTILTKKKFLTNLLIHAALALGLLCISPFIGAVPIKFSALFGDGPLKDIFLSYRLPRAISAFILGGSLSLSGAVLQSTLKNPLVEPYTLGISSVSALGAFLASTYLSFIPLSGIFSSLFFSATTLFFIYALSARKNTFSIHDLVLSGITLSIFAGSVITLMRFVTSPFTAGILDRWLTGSLAFSSWKTALFSAVFSLPLVLFAFIKMNAYNNLYFADDISLSRGVDVKSLQKISFIVVSVFVAGSVAFFGPIGFVGLIVPHIEKKISGHDYRTVLPGSFFSGSIFLLFADIAARKTLQPAELPVGVVTALLGAPFFLYILLFRGRKEKH
ncbi:iron ABC transporter permease [candidate division WOR-3 bacterium]|nr:iron ABC transporter permease [candidate division WOR-3 bacterium]